MKSILKLSVFVFASLILSGCQSKLKPVELDVIGNESCQPPCWRGIIPGKTTADETIRIFQKWQMEDKGTWKRNTGEKDHLKWDYICWVEEVWPEICLKLESDIVESIDLRISSPQSIHLEDIIEKYEEPDGFTLELCPDCSGYGISIYYPKAGLFFTAGGKGKLQITPKMLITRAIFVKSTDREGMIKLLFGTERIEDNEVGYKEWSSYGIISEMNP